MTTNIFISAGEASGEAYGALLVSELKRRLQQQGREANFIGMGGPRMAAAGLERIVNAEDVAVMGITEVVRHLPRIYREFRKLKRALRDRSPAVAVLIDFPDIHFKLAAECHRLGIPVVYFVSPQLWAWKKHRIKLVQKYVDRMLVIFPFEEPFYREHGVNAEFVGHPLAEIPAPTISREDFARQNGLDPEKTWIGLLPGSRAKEIRDNLHEMLEAARLLIDSPASETNSGPPEINSAAPFQEKGHDFSRAENPPNEEGALARELCQFILPLAPTLTARQREWVRGFVQSQASELPVHLVLDARAALHHSRASIVASGTATVEAALIGNPFVVVYRVSPITYAIAERLVTVPHVAMVNLIAGKRLVPELIQHNFTASNMVRHLQPLLPDGPPRQSMMKELACLRSKLTKSASSGPMLSGSASGEAIARVAGVTLELLENGASDGRIREKR